MNDLLKDKLNSIAEDIVLKQALKELFYGRVEKERPLDSNDDEKVLGQKYRAYLAGKSMIDEAFKELESFQIKANNKKQVNRGR